MSLVDVLSTEERRVAAAFQVSAPPTTLSIRHDKLLPVAVSYAYMYPHRNRMSYDVYVTNPKQELKKYDPTVSAALRVLQWAQVQYNELSFEDFQLARKFLSFESAEQLGVEPIVQDVFMHGLDKFFSFYALSLVQHVPFYSGLQPMNFELESHLREKEGSGEIAVLSWCESYCKNHAALQEISSTMGFFLASRYVSKHGRDVAPLIDMMVKQNIVEKSPEQFDPFHMFMRVARSLM